MKKIIEKIRYRLPKIGLVDMYEGDYEKLQGKFKYWQHGNCNRFIKPVPFKIGFSGSQINPYSSLHVYIWKVDIWFMKNPFKPIMTWWKEYKMDKELKKSDERCPHCGSWKLREGEGMGYEPIVYCKKCGSIIWEADPEPYIR